MYRIDGPGATVDNKFTEGDPVGGVQATVVTDDWLNDVQEEVMSVLSAGGVTPVKGTQDQLLQSLYKLLQVQKATAFSAAGTATVLTLTPSPAISAYATNQRWAVKFPVNSGLNPTLNVSAKGAKSLKQYDSTGAKVAAAFVADQIGDVVYDGVDFVLIDPLPSGNAQPGIIGSVRNLRALQGGVATVIPFTADEIIVGASLGGLQYRLSNFNKSINLGNTGVGGMDAGAAPANGYIAVYAIFNPTSGVSGLLGVNATSAVAPNVYAGANMPAGFTASGLISVWGTNASGQFKAGGQYDRTINFPPVTVLNSTAGAASFTILNISQAIPLNAIEASGSIGVNSNGGSANTAVASEVTGAGTQQVTANSLVNITATFKVLVTTGQRMYYTFSSTGASATITAFISEYKI